MMAEVSPVESLPQSARYGATPEDRPTGLMRAGSFALGVVLVGVGLVDGAFNPFGFLTADKLIGFGIPLIVVGVTGKKGAKT